MPETTPAALIAPVEPCAAFVQVYPVNATGLAVACPECRWQGPDVFTITSHYLTKLQQRHDKQSRHEAAKAERHRVREAVAALQAEAGEQSG